MGRREFVGVSRIFLNNFGVLRFDGCVLKAEDESPCLLTPVKRKLFSARKLINHNKTIVRRYLLSENEYKSLAPRVDGVHYYFVGSLPPLLDAEEELVKEPVEASVEVEREMKPLPHWHPHAATLTCALCGRGAEGAAPPCVAAASSEGEGGRRGGDEEGEGGEAAAAAAAAAVSAGTLGGLLRFEDVSSKQGYMAVHWRCAVGCSKVTLPLIHECSFLYIFFNPTLVLCLSAPPMYLCFTRMCL